MVVDTPVGTGSDCEDPAVRYCCCCYGMERIAVCWRTYQEVVGVSSAEKLQK